MQGVQGETNTTDQGMICVIGAGASGITAAKNLLARGIPCEVIEREDEVGGNWYYGKSSGSVYRSTHLISSKTMTAFPDFPMPADYPDYPNHAQVLDYLRSYARHFGLYKHIRFNTSVEQVERAADDGWDVTLKLPDGTLETRHYAGVTIANGHLWDPHTPPYPGTFTGTALHSKQYRTPDILRDKRVLVIGAGNSGCDIAVEAAQNAARTFHSTRRGYHYIPKFIFGRPVDQVNELSLRLGVPRFIRRTTQSLLIRMVAGDPQRYGLPRPDHRLLDSHPIVNSQMLYYLGHGDITPKPDVAELCGDRVAFRDGSVEAIDVIVYATGYRVSFPFIEQRHLNWGSHGPRLYLHVFHPTYDNLFVAGLIQPDSGQWWIVDYQSQLIARYIEAQRQDNNSPAVARFRARKAGPQPDLCGGRRMIDTPRHYLEIEHHSYKKLLQRLLSDL